MGPPYPVPARPGSPVTTVAVPSAIPPQAIQPAGGCGGVVSKYLGLATASRAATSLARPPASGCGPSSSSRATIARTFAATLAWNASWPAVAGLTSSVRNPATASRSSLAVGRPGGAGEDHGRPRPQPGG